MQNVASTVSHRGDRLGKQNEAGLHLLMHFNEARTVLLILVCQWFEIQKTEITVIHVQQLGNTCLLKMWHTIFFCTIVANEYVCNSCRLKNGKLKRVTSKTCKYMCVPARQEHSCHLDLPIDRRKTTCTLHNSTVLEIVCFLLVMTLILMVMVTPPTKSNWKLLGPYN